MIERRGFLVGLMGLLGFAAVVSRRQDQYGYVDVKSAKRFGWHPARVLLNGLDVSNDCVACDDLNGSVVLFRRNDAGHHYIDPHTHKVAFMVKRGHVVFIPRAQP